MPIHTQVECTVGTRDITNICESVSGGSRKERLSTFAVLGYPFRFRKCLIVLFIFMYCC